MTVSEFLSGAYTCYHACDLGEKMLREAGFVNIDSGTCENAKGYYRVCGGSLFALRAGNANLMLALSHTDSPCLRIRDCESKNATVGVERYGGALMRSLLDRKLIIAGSVVKNSKGTLKAHSVQSDFNIIIPSVAVHLGGGDDGEKLNLSADFKPLLGGGKSVLEALNAADAISADLYCVPAEEAYAAGADGQYICSPRIDNSVSVYACLQSIINCENKATVAIACYNNEETGSATRYGACSVSLQAFLSDAYKALKIKREACEDLRNSFALSCDGSHALHPNHPEKHTADITLGGGVVIKRNDRYATEALTEAAVKQIFGDAGLKTQVYFHHPDMRCGSTVGLTAANNLGAAVCDIGIPQLSMHSAVETAAISDVNDLIAGVTAYFNRVVTVKPNEITVK